MTLTETRFFQLGGDLPLESGRSLTRPTVAYRTWGNPDREAVLICHALTGNADADDWWKDLFKAGSICDPGSNYVIAANVIGSCYGSTGPTSIDPETSKPYGASFPAITVRDVVASQRALLDELGVERLKLVIGGSMGGMQALEWAAIHPEIVGATVAIGTGPTQSAWAIALSEAQRAAIISDPEFRDGDYSWNAGPAKGLAAARMIAMISYRSPANFEQRFGRRTGTDGYEVQRYLNHQGEKIVERFDANSYLTLMGVMDSHDLGRGRHSVEAALRGIEVPALLVGISTDVLYPPSEVREMASHIPRGVYRTLHAPQGHDAFLIEVEELDQIVQGFLREVKGGRVGASSRDRGRGAAWA